MKQENFNTIPPIKEKSLLQGLTALRKPRILVAPLDWGLGHATRCIPVIYELINQECEVWLGAEGPQRSLLQQEFPDLSFLPLKGYRIRYGRSSGDMLRSILWQTPVIIRAIREENEWLKSMTEKYRFDAVIADNRYGLHHPSIPCIFMTHQLMIKTKLGSWSERLLQKRNYKYINRFTECWVPDVEGENNLAGELSHPRYKPEIPVNYTGLLSRFENKVDHSPKAGSLLIILSGPEPQRSILEEKIIKDVAHYNGSATIVRGLPGTLTLIPSTNSIRFYNHLPAEELNTAMLQADYVICRSGYSTIMDAIKLQKKTVLIPTPGQPEQEYLAAYLQGKNIALAISQKSFSLSGALQQARSFRYSIPVNSNKGQLSLVISQFISSLQIH